MLNRLLIAVVIGVVVGLVCLLVGALLASIPVPFVAVVGKFLAALWSFATGRTTLYS